MMPTLARATMGLAVWRWTSGRLTSLPQPTLLIPVQQRVNTDVMKQSAATTGQMSDMMGSVTKMDVTSTHGGWEMRPSMDLEMTLQLTQQNQ